MKVVRIAGYRHAAHEPGDQCHRSVDHIRGTGSTTQLPDGPGLGPIQRVNRYWFGRQHPNEAHLARRVTPGLCEDRGWHVDLLGQLEQPDHPAIGSIDGDESAGVEHYRPRTLRAHAVSSSVAGPSSARISARTSARRSRRARSAMAAATQVLTDGARPAATAASPSTVTVTRVRILEDNPWTGPELSPSRHRRRTCTRRTGHRPNTYASRWAGPTGRNPAHYDIEFDDLESGVDALCSYEHRVAVNPYHDR